ncbi:MAG: hypothetical protein JW830_07880 [Bacteroidales bacterium]|nr:hypothetical protein [Bacteroidales bacterium]
MKKFILLCCLPCLFLCRHSYTQSRTIRELNYEQGLHPATDLSRMLQDHRGFIWIGGSNYGLQRYDGYEFVNYSQFKRPVLYLDEDKQGLFWLGTNDGLYVMNPENEKFIYYIPPHPEPNWNNRVFKVLEDRNGILWCGATYGVYKMVPKVKDGNKMKDLIFENGIDSVFTITNYRFPESDSSRFSVWEIYEDSRGYIWVGTPQGLFIYDTDNNKFTRIDDHSDCKSKLINEYVITVVEEDPDVIWVRSLGGFTRISNLTKAITPSVIDKDQLDFRYYSPDFSIDFGWDAWARTFLIDARKDFWFGTAFHGLVKMTLDQHANAQYEKVYPEMDKPEGGLFSEVRSVISDHTGLIWTCHESGRIRRIREGNILFTHLEEKLAGDPPAKYDFTYCTEDQSSNLWICNWGSGLYKITKDGKVANFKLTDPAARDTMGNLTWSVLEIDKDNLWVGAQYGVWRLNVKTGKSQKLFTQYINNTSVMDLFRFEDYIVLSTSDQGFWLYNINTHKLNQYIADHWITSLDILRNREIWAGTDKGLSRFAMNETTGEIDSLPRNNAYADVNQMITRDGWEINKIHEDRAGILWFGTTKGLIRLDTGSDSIRKWTQEDGLCNNNVLSIEEDNHGCLWLSGTDGLSMMDPATYVIKTFNESNGLPKVKHWSKLSFKDKTGRIYFGGLGSFYRFNPDDLHKNNNVPVVVITDLRLFNKSVRVDSARKAILTRNIAYTTEIHLKYNQNDVSFTFAALDYNDPMKNKYAYMLEGYQKEWIYTNASNRMATYTNLNPGQYVFRVRGSNNDGIWNEEGTSIRIFIHPPFWKTAIAYIVYAVLFLLMLRGYIFWRMQRIRKEKEILEKQVNDRTEEIQEVNTLLEEQKEELMQQKEELQTTLENLQKTQEQLIESEKLSALGGLVAGVAHEINTPVGIGVTAVSNLQEEIKEMAVMYKKDEISRKDFKEFLESANDSASLIHKNLERTALLIQSFKQVSVDQVSEQQRSFNFKSYLGDIIRSLSPKFKHKDITFNLYCDEELLLNSYPGAYAQVFTNLLLNTFTHGFHDRQQGTVTITAKQKERRLEIEYRDDGNGISSTDLPHIFEPFYTSDQHKGTGLGLNIVYNIVKQKLHGSISCKSNPGKGVLFMIELPITT